MRLVRLDELLQLVLHVEPRVVVPALPLLQHQLVGLLHDDPLPTIVGSSLVFTSSPSPLVDVLKMLVCVFLSVRVFRRVLVSFVVLVHVVVHVVVRVLVVVHVVVGVRVLVRVGLLVLVVVLVRLEVVVVVDVVVAVRLRVRAAKVERIIIFLLLNLLLDDLLFWLRCGFLGGRWLLCLCRRRNL